MENPESQLCSARGISLVTHVRRGLQGAAVPQPGTAQTLLFALIPTEPWYVVKGVGDLDEDNKKAIYIS